MVKTGVVEGAVKTAEADNRGDPIGSAAKCIAAAKESVLGLSAIAKSIEDMTGGAEKDGNDKNDRNDRNDRKIESAAGE